VTWRASILTLYPEMFPGPLGHSLPGEGLRSGAWELDVANIREQGIGRHRRVDDSPAGGGPGMVIRCDVAAAAIDAAWPLPDPRPRLLMSPRGKRATQGFVRELAAGPGIAIFCGRFEGIDERVIEARNLVEVSLGDIVLAGGEIAAMALVEACVRLLPGVMGKEASGTEESFETGLLEYPHFTRPRDFEGRPIPEVLLSGDHARIAAWRRAEAERLTRERRPDLIQGCAVSSTSKAADRAGRPAGATTCRTRRDVGDGRSSR
jgi:tRNA (guanine37-N1)-methyltransferase